MEHTKEPWIVGEHTTTMCAIRDHGGKLVADTGFRYDDIETKANARRIVACVNACDGLDTEIIERNVGNVWKLLQQRDELLLALEHLCNRTEFVAEAIDWPAYQKARAAIAKVEGE